MGGGTHIHTYIHAATCFINYMRGLSQLIERKGKIKEGFIEKGELETS